MEREISERLGLPDGSDPVKDVSDFIFSVRAEGELREYLEVRSHIFLLHPSLPSSPTCPYSSHFYSISGYLTSSPSLFLYSFWGAFSQ